MYKPSIRSINFSYSKDLLGLGTKFFIIQIFGVIIFSTSNLLISHFFSPEHVTPYNIAFKYFSIITITFSIINKPFWTSITDAYSKNDIRWIKSVINKLIKTVGIFSLLSIILVIFSGSIYRLWIGDKIHIPLSLTIIMSIYTITGILNGIFVSFINGTGKIKFELYLAFINGVIFFPLILLFVKYFNMGIEGIALSILIINLSGSIFYPLQYYLIINNKASGIWIK